MPTDDGMGWGQDHVVLNCHGLLNTHIDGLNHVAVNDTFYGGRAVDDPEQGSVDVLARSGLLDARRLRRHAGAARHALGGSAGHGRGPRRRARAGRRSPSSPATRSCSTWVATASRRRAAIRSADPRATPTPAAASPARARAGSPSTASRCSSGTCSTPASAKLTHASAHVLTWAIGLLLVDNCDFSDLRAAIGPGSQVAGAIVIAPLVIEGANGVNLNPLILR